MSKICRKCLSPKEMTEFFKDNSREDNKTSLCKECFVEMAEARKRKNKLKYIPKTLKQIKAFFNDFEFNFIDFENVSPYHVSELIPRNRKRGIVEWRQIGVTIKCLELGNWNGHKTFNIKHCTAIHSANAVLEALQGYNDELKAMFLSVLNPETIDKKRSEDENINYAVCLAQMDALIAEML